MKNQKKLYYLIEHTIKAATTLIFLEQTSGKRGPRNHDC